MVVLLQQLCWCTQCFGRPGKGCIEKYYQCHYPLLIFYACYFETCAAGHLFLIN